MSRRRPSDALVPSTYDSPAISTRPFSHEIPPRSRRRARRGTLERPVNGRAYCGAWLLVALPLLIAAFSVTGPGPLPPPDVQSIFDGLAATEAARELATLHPDRSPGTAGAVGAATWVRDRLRVFFPRGVVTDGFEAEIPGRGRVTLRNIVAVAPAPSPEAPAIVVMAHRDSSGLGPGANDNASGTAALLELARTFSRPRLGTERVSHRLVFLSTDGGAFGGLGAERFAEHSPYVRGAVAVVNLDSIAGPGRPRIEIAGDQARSPSARLVETAVTHIVERTGLQPGRTSMLGQLIDLGFPFSLYDQAPLVGRGIPAVTLTTAGNAPPESFGDTPDALVAKNLGDLGHAAERTVWALDGSLELASGTTSYLYVGQRFVRGWAVELALIAMLVPFLIAAVDLFALCRRRRIPLAPALRSYRSRLGFWLWAGIAFQFLALVGAFADGAARPLNPESDPARDWPVLSLVLLGLLAAPGWIVSRSRIIPRRPPTAEEELAGHTAAMLALGVVALLVVAVNPFALLFLLPSLHAWLWLPNLAPGRRLLRASLLAAGLLGPLMLLGSFASRFGLGFDAPWYLAQLVAIDYVSIVAVFLALAWLAAAAQLVVLAAGRYAPYPEAAERPPRGPIRNTVRAIVLGTRSRRRRVPLEEREALEG